jgi:hypothetical protein
MFWRWLIADKVTGPLCCLNAKSIIAVTANRPFVVSRIVLILSSESFVGWPLMLEQNSQHSPTASLIQPLFCFNRLIATASCAKTAC